MIRLAVLADIHLHDPAFGRGAAATPLLRSLADTSASTRVFTESGAALDAALRGIAAESLPLCLIAGDLTDDGQPANWRAVARRLADHSRRHGTRFFACPGNHDQFALAGRPLAKGFVDGEGRVQVLAGGTRAGDLTCPGMRMAGAEKALDLARGLGYRRDPRDLHYETPFGPADDPRARLGRVTSPAGEGALIPDASYLVEPVAGLWLLSLDATVWLPDGAGGFLDLSGEGWTAARRHKPWLLPWIADVVARAGRAGKALVAFSHYPVTDIFSGTLADLLRLGGPRAGQRRMPDREDSRAIAATCLGLHFSGHWHVDAVAAVAGGPTVNVALPSTVGFPAGWKVVEIGAGAVRIRDRWLGYVPGFDLALARYRAEVARGGGDASLGHAADYAAFLGCHFRTLVLTRRLAEDWPPAMRPLVGKRLGDLLGEEVAGADAGLALADLFVDWYRLREAGGGAAAIPAARRRQYRALVGRLVGRLAARPPPEPLATFLATLGRHLQADAARRATLARIAPRAAAETEAETGAEAGG
ncbi:MAG: metallophosphoesterase [Rhodobacteraceae bacterium]|nr:metallophosphoesterase [Paracoccaceae bacterium]